MGFAALFGLVAGVAVADVAALSEACEPAELVGLAPSDGDLGLPPDTVLALVFDADGCGNPQVDGVLMHAGGAVVPTTLSGNVPVFRVVPDAPLEPGDYIADLLVNGESVVVHFGVEGGAYLPPAEADVRLTAGRRCDRGTITARARVTAQFPEASSSEQGVLLVSVETEHATELLAAPFAGESEVTLETVLPGGRELCAVVGFQDVTGEVAWELDPICAEPQECEAPDATSWLGFGGCDTAGGGAALLLPLVLLLTRRRALGAAALVACAPKSDGVVDSGTIELTTTVTVEGEETPAPIEPTEPTDTAHTAHTGDTGDTATSGWDYVPLDPAVVPPELAGERTWCWTMSDEGSRWLYAVGGDTGTVVKVSPWFGNGGVPLQSLAIHDGWFVAPLVGAWNAYELSTGSSGGSSADAVYAAGVAVVGSDIVARTGDELRVYSDWWDLLRGHEREVRVGFDGLDVFTDDGSHLIGLRGAELVVVDAVSGAQVSAVPWALPAGSGWSLADGDLHVLDAAASHLIRVDPATGLERSRVDLVTAEPSFAPGGLWCAPHGR